MDQQFKEIVWSQLDAAIETMKRAIEACPDHLWSDSAKPVWKEREVVGFWYLAFHTTFWFDFYMTDPANLGDDPEQSFKAPPPFNEDEFDDEGVLPERAYSKPEILNYLDYARSKARLRLNSIDDLNAPSVRRKLGAMELMLYNMRHLQHHAAQMNHILRQQTGDAPNWVSKGEALSR